MYVIDRQYVYLWNVEQNGATSYQFTRETNSVLILINVTEKPETEQYSIF